MGFGDSVRATANKMLEEVNNRCNFIAVEWYGTGISLTPIGAGRKNDPPGKLINNWYLGIGTGNYNRSYSTVTNTSGAASYAQVSKIRALKEFLGRDGEISLTNSTPYGFRAEYAGWPAPEWSGSSVPYAMVRTSLALTAAKYK